MKQYIATAKAGRRISGQPNPGVGNTIRLGLQAFAAGEDGGPRSIEEVQEIGV